MAVRSGAAKPDIRSVDALKRALLRAKSIAYSHSASGVYIENELFPRLGIAEQITVFSAGVTTSAQHPEAGIGAHRIPRLAEGARRDHQKRHRADSSLSHSRDRAPLRE